MRPRALFSSRSIFVDTSAYFAVTDTRQANHPIALAIARRLAAEHRPMVTSNFVLAETHALLVNRIGHRIALNVLQELDHSQSLTVVRVSAADEDRARQILVQYHDKPFSLTDTTSFAIMERLKIGQVFTFDRDFAQFGFAPLSG